MSDHEYLTPEQLRRLEVMIAQSLRQAEKERAPNPFARVAELLLLEASESAHGTSLRVGFAAHGQAGNAQTVDSATAGTTDEHGVVAGSAVALRERVATLESELAKAKHQIATTKKF